MLSLPWNGHSDQRAKSKAKREAGNGCEATVALSHEKEDVS